MDKRKQPKKTMKTAKKPVKPSKGKQPVRRKNLDGQEKLKMGFEKQGFMGQGAVTTAFLMQDLSKGTAEEAPPSPPAEKDESQLRGKTEEEDQPTGSEAPPVQGVSVPLETEPAPGDAREAKEDQHSDTDKAAASEPQKDFSTQRESIEELDPKDIRPFYTIPDYLEPTSSMYPMVVKTPDSITCIDGWPQVQQAQETGQMAITCHIYHLAEVSVAELALRKVAGRTRPQGGFDSYAERARNCKKCKELLLASDEGLVAYAHGGARRGLTFCSQKEQNVTTVLSRRLGKSEETTDKYLLHAAHLNDEAFRVLVGGKADRKFFDSVQGVKGKLIETLKGQKVKTEDIITRVSEEICRVHQTPKEARAEEIKNLLTSLAPAQPQQSGNAAKSVASGPEKTIAHEEEGEAQIPGEGQIEEEKAEEQEKGKIAVPAEEKPQPQERPELSMASTVNPESQDYPESNEQEVRTRGIDIAEKMKAHFANPEVSLSVAKKEIRKLLATLDGLLAGIPDA